MSKKTGQNDDLSLESADFFRAIQNDFSIDDPAGIKILRVACQALDRAEAARRVIESDGMVLTGRDGQAKAHPLLSVERDARSAFLAGMKALRLDMEPIKPVGRPPMGR